MANDKKEIYEMHLRISYITFLLIYQNQWTLSLDLQLSYMRDYVEPNSESA